MSWIWYYPCLLPKHHLMFLCTAEQLWHSIPEVPHLHRQRAPEMCPTADSAPQTLGAHPAKGPTTVNGTNATVRPPFGRDLTSPNERCCRSAKHQISEHCQQMQRPWNEGQRSARWCHQRSLKLLWFLFPLALNPFGWNLFPHPIVTLIVEETLGNGRARSWTCPCVSRHQGKFDYYR